MNISKITSFNGLKLQNKSNFNTETKNQTTPTSNNTKSNALELTSNYNKAIAFCGTEKDSAIDEGEKLFNELIPLADSEKSLTKADFVKIQARKEELKEKLNSSGRRIRRYINNPKESDFIPIHINKIQREEYQKGDEYISIFHYPNKDCYCYMKKNINYCYIKDENGILQPDSIRIMHKDGDEVYSLSKKEYTCTIFPYTDHEATISLKDDPNSDWLIRT